MNEQSQSHPQPSQGPDSHGTDVGPPPPPYSDRNQVPPSPYGTHPSSPTSPYPDPNQVPPNPYGVDPETNSAPPNPHGANPGQVPPDPPSYPPPGGYPSNPPGPTTNPVVESGKVAMADAASVLKRLQKDPTQGLQAALTSLGDDRAFNVGILLCCAFVLTSWWAIWRVSNAIFGFLTFSLNRFASGPDFTPELGITDHLKIILLSALPVVIMSGVLAAIQKSSKAGSILNRWFLLQQSLFCPLRYCSC